MRPVDLEAWKEVIVEHSQFPRGTRELTGATHQGHGENPFCGDRVRVQLLIDAEDRIADVACLASGCAISLASASLLAETVRGLGVDEARARVEAVRTMLVSAEPMAASPDSALQALQMVRQYPTRVKCATLAWHSLRHALDGLETAAVTET